jgi:hypothetical protein
LAVLANVFYREVYMVQHRQQQQCRWLQRDKQPKVMILQWGLRSNFLFGTIGGGILHAGGGIVADALRARDMSTSRVNEIPGAATEKSPSPEIGLPSNHRRRNH